MKMTFKKIAAATMAVASLAVGMVGMSASAYGGYNYETYNNVSVEKYIDCSKSVAGGHTKCDSTSCSYVLVSVTANNSSTGLKSDRFYLTRGLTRGKAEVYVTPDSGKSFSNASTSHYVTISGSSKWLNCMIAYAG